MIESRRTQPIFAATLTTGHFQQRTRQQAGAKRAARDSADFGPVFDKTMEEVRKETKST